ncbi:hypothetical protein [Paraburkholderia aromaticivorans]|uniref:hypothetical protein n=1 Tax=Paraburkholderia aromaticivorans TaxID=2026199 RepID=UPI00145616E7|nr:hypothetical protein [Paraburkholderia aromaticivorans]
MVTPVCGAAAESWAESPALRYKRDLVPRRKLDVPDLRHQAANFCRLHNAFAQPTTRLRVDYFGIPVALCLMEQGKVVAVNARRGFFIVAIDHGDYAVFELLSDIDANVAEGSWHK